MAVGIWIQSCLVFSFPFFSLGPRNCPGRNLASLELRLILSDILFAFDIEADCRIEDWEEQQSWILWVKRPLYVRLQLRDDL